MIEIKNFRAIDFEFEEITRIYNRVSHDARTHIDIEKENWSLLDKKVAYDRLLLYNDNSIIGFLRYMQGRESNKQKCFFNIFIDPVFNGNGYRQLLYDNMLEDIKSFNCNGLYMEIFDHPNYTNSKIFLENNGFVNKFKIREYSLNLNTLDLSKYEKLINKLEMKGIKFCDSKLELSILPNHYEKLEELEWLISQDFPMPDGLSPERGEYEDFLKYQKIFEEKRYGIEIIAIDGDEYIGSTDLEVYPEVDSTKAWTGGLGVIKKYRRQGIATALKIKAFQKLKEKGVRIVRTDNEENNPMYLINVELGFKPEPYGLEYQKNI